MVSSPISRACFFSSLLLHPLASDKRFYFFHIAVPARVYENAIAHCGHDLAVPTDIGMSRLSGGYWVPDLAPLDNAYPRFPRERGWKGKRVRGGGKDSSPTLALGGIDVYVLIVTRLILQHRIKEMSTFFFFFTLSMRSSRAVTATERIWNTHPRAIVHLPVRRP